MAGVPMKMPSLRVVGSKAALAFRRFPLSIICSVVATFLLIWTVERQLDFTKEDFIRKMIFLCILGMPLFAAISFYRERKQPGNAVYWLINALTVGLLVVFYFFFNNNGSDYVRYALYIISAILFITFAGFIRLKNEPGFWQFNKTIFTRLVLSGFFCVVLYLGIMIALKALEVLFNINWHQHNIYLDLWFATNTMLIPWSFLAITPESYEETDTFGNYSNLLKIFAQYILVPVACIYLLILYAYQVKILVQWQLPKGWMSSLIIAYAAVGLLALLLVYPLRDKEGSGWIRKYSGWFFITLFPLLFSMYFAITRRISDYGITESRYLLIALWIWLICISVYYMIWKFNKIKYLPISFVIASLIVTIGPWNAFRVSEDSQIDRFIRILKDNKMIVDGKVQQVKTMKKKDFENMNSIYKYIENFHGLKNLKQRLIAETDADKALMNDSIQLYPALKIDYEALDKGYDSEIYFSNKNHGLNNITGYDLFIPFSSSDRDDEFNKVYMNGKDKLELTYNKVKGITFALNDNKNEALTFPLVKIAGDLYSKYGSELPDSSFILENENGNLRVKLLIQNFDYQRNGAETNVHSLNAMVFVKKKNI